MFSFEFCKNFKNTFFTEHLRATPSEKSPAKSNLKITSGIKQTARNEINLHVFAFVLVIWKRINSNRVFEILLIFFAVPEWCWINKSLLFSLRRFHISKADSLEKSNIVNLDILANNKSKITKLIGTSEFNPLNPNPTKWSNTLKQFVGRLPTNCLSMFDHFVGWRLKG